MRCLIKNESAFRPEAFADVTPETFAGMFSDDRGPIPFPDLEALFALTRAYGKSFRTWGQTPTLILRSLVRSESRLEDFLSATRAVPGYDHDPFLKKNRLLAMALHRRPEQFLRVSHSERWKPIVDYHLMRVSARLGLIHLAEPEYHQL